MTGGLLRPRTIGFVLLGALLLVFPYLYTWPFIKDLPFLGGFVSPFRTFQMARFGVWLIILLGLNILTGYSGQITLGHAAFVAVGAYIAAILMTQYGSHVIVAVLAAGFLTGLLGFLVGAPALRLTGPYLAIATLAIIIALPQFLKHDLVDDWTNGVQGIDFRVVGTAPVPPEMLDEMVDRDQWLYYCTMVPGIALTVLAWNITRSRMGRAFIALRDTEIGAQQMGVDVSLYKMAAFGLSAFYAGIGGGLFVFTESYLGPATFDIIISITMLAVLVLGGLASILGTIFAALIMTFRVELVDQIAALIPRGEELRIDTLRGAIYGGLLIVSIIFTPYGVAGVVRELRAARPSAILVSAPLLRAKRLLGLATQALSPRRASQAEPLPPGQQAGGGDKGKREGGDAPRP